MVPMRFFYSGLLWCVSLFWFSNAAPSDETVVSWSDVVAGAIKGVVDDVMRNDDFQRIVNEQPYTEVFVDGSVSAASVAAQLARLFNDMKQITVNMAVTYEENDGFVDSEIANVGLSVDTDYSIVADSVLEEERFFTSVSYAESAFKRGGLNSEYDVQQADITRTAGLTDLFKATETDATSKAGTAFQYFGTESGVLRVFPGHEWMKNADGSYAEYDPRLTPWYARTVSGPKNVVILMDISNPDDWARVQLATLSVLSTISMDDYVTVIGYHSTTAYLLNCFTHSSLGPVLVRGTVENVARLKAMVADEIELSSMAASEAGNGVDNAFTWAFSALTSSAATNVGALASCESAIVMVSSGSLEGDGSYIEASNTMDARVFSYGINGVGNSNFLREVACDSRGMYTQVTDDDGAAAVGLYYRYILQVTDSPWFTYGGGLRPDLLSSGDDSNGAISHYTVTRAAWDRSTSPPTLMGVAATDFNMYRVKDSMDAHRFQQSFPMLVNNEGDTLYHPLQTVYKRLHLYDVGRDISNYENFPGWEDTVRVGFLSGGVGEATLSVPRPLQKGDAVFEGVDTETLVTTYFWQKVPDLPFYIAFAYAAEDLVQRSFRLDKYGNTDGLYRAVPILALPEMEDLVPSIIHDYTSPEVEHLLNGRVFYNDYNCPGPDGEVFGNCVEDQYCIDNGLDCTGTCVCHPHRWPVFTVAKWCNTGFGPNCFKDPSVAFTEEDDPAQIRELMLFMNQEKYSQNPFPVITDECLLEAALFHKYCPNVAEVMQAGNHNRTVWRYVGLASGTMGNYPANNFGRAYDPTRRPWYSRAIAYKGQYQYVISTPYNDAGGAGLMVTFTEAVWQEQIVDPGPDYKKIINDRVFGVHGWDMLYPDFNSYAPTLTADIDGGCSTKFVQDQLSSDSQPMCFLMDPSGLLLSHSDFMVSEADQAAVGGENGIIGGDVGVWPIENVFIGKKEPSVGMALVDAGLLVQQSEVTNADSKMLLSWFQVNRDVLPASGVLSGSLPSDNCLEPGATWQVAHVAASNVYLVVVSGYQRQADLSSCEPYEADPVVAIEFDTCDFSVAAAERTRGALECPLHDKPESLDLEPSRLDYAKCAAEQYVSSNEGVGTIAMALSIVGIICTLALTGAIFVFRDRYVLRAASPTFCMLMCMGGLFGFALELSLIGKPTDGICVARNWLAGLCMVFLYSPLLAKTWRIHKIFNNKAMKKLRIRNSELMKAIVVVAVTQALILLAWTIAEPPKQTLKQDDVDPLLFTVECDSENFQTWAWLQISFSAVVVLFGVYMCFATRNIMGEFNESSQIATVIYNMFFMALIIIPMVYGLDVDYQARFVLTTVGVLAVSMVTLLVLFVPKFFNINKTKADFSSTATGTSTGAGRRTSQQTDGDYAS